MIKNKLLLLLVLLMTAATGAWAQTGMTKGSFSVSATKRVHFSKGNLQLVGENTFQFAENQWDVFGSSQSNGHRDLFGWGSANNPDLISENNNDYSTFTDWGTKIGDGTTWRTLTNDEWNYVLNTRTASTLNGTVNARYAYATVNGVGGLILFPDNYTHPGTVAAPAQINTPSNAFNANTYSANTYDVNAWAAMEDAGAVFLPHGGCRTGSSYQSNQPNYWSSTPISEALAHGLNLSPMEFKNWFRFRGCAVRLVTDEYVLTLADGTQDAKNWTIASGDNSVKGDVADGLTGLNEGDAVTLTYGGRLKVKSVKAVKVDPSVTRVTTFSGLQTALSAGKNVKLMNDIVCTSEIEITSGALTIDGNGKKLSTTSAIRAFKVGSSATVAFKNLTLTGFVNGGGPAINNSGTTVLDGCTISNCHVNNSNGGGAIESSGKLYAVNTTFSGNYSGEIGGAINNAWGSLYMSDCTFTNNYTTSSNAFYGGAIGINGGSEVRLINCTFSGNKYGKTAGTNDIGVYWKPGNYTIAGCIGATIAPRAGVGDITTNATGTATLDYSDLSNISFTYTAE